MARALVMMSDSYSCCNCWKQDDQCQSDAKKRLLNHSAPTASTLNHNATAARIAKYSSIKSWSSHGTAGKVQHGMGDPRHEDWRFCHLDSTSEYISAYRALFSIGPASDGDGLKNANCRAARALKHFSMRTNCSKLRVSPPSLQLHNSIAIIGISRNSKRGHEEPHQFGTNDVIEHFYLAGRLGTWQPHCVDELADDQRFLYHQRPAELSAMSSDANTCRENAGDPAMHCGRLLAGKLRPVSIVDSSLYISDHSSTVKPLKCSTPERNSETNSTATDHEKTIKKAVDQLVHFRGSIAARVFEARPPPVLHASKVVVASSLPTQSNRDEGDGCTELNMIYRGERSRVLKPDEAYNQLAPCRSARHAKSPSNNRHPQVQELFKAVCPSRSLQCFLRSKQRRCLHYRKAVLGEGTLTLPHDHDVNKKWSFDSSIVHPN